ncbi:hypothetical protein HAHE_32920 [Haloferula helveola]|uniref:Uncharacterized protein n=1 Tax=Haloferula helveola TaxID=490095 RepID=A0ABN6H760_9BACT|nr:hypothetical protein HAHE_32920 [Haloferula helveola]
MSASSALAREGTGRWDDESIAEYSQRLFDWLTKNFEERAKRIGDERGAPFDLPYKYLAPTDDRKKLRMLEKFKEGSLSSRAAEEHIGETLKEFEAVRKLIAAEEEKLAKTWKSDDANLVVKDGKIYDQRVSAARLGVILDNSPSMTPYLPKLREEIGREFTDAHFVEVDGCRLTHLSDNQWFFTKPVSGINPFTADRHIPRVPQLGETPHSTYIRWTRDAVSALMSSVEKMHCDALYWFCDFEDSTDDDLLRTLGRTMLAKKVTVYVHTLSRRPPELINELAKRSGGEVIRKRI